MNEHSEGLTMNHPAFNPYLPSYEYVPDGEPRAFDDRLYVYGSHDLFGGTDFCLGDYALWSAPLDNLGKWRCEGIIYRKEQDPKNRKGKMHMCAPDCVKGGDGRYYLYYQLHALTCTSVAVADSPTGPFEFYGYVQHPDGTPWGMKKGDSFAFDPGVLVDDNGQAYLYVGFSPVGLFKTVFKLRGNRVDQAVCLMLEPDMKTVRGKEMPVVPGHDLAKGTSFEGHAFFEASSPRKIKDTYYFVYSSELSHELCYATSKHPDRDFRYGGTLVSIADIGYKGNAVPLNYTGNTHGGMVEVNNQWFIFYHRQTNKQKCSRQGCAEKIYILPDGSIPQAEVTSCGLNDGPLPGKGRYEARIACNLNARNGIIFSDTARKTDKKNLYPYFTQSGNDRERDGDQYIANMRDGAWAGFKYFRFDGTETAVSVLVRGTADGFMKLFFDRDREPIAIIPIKAATQYCEYSDELTGISGIIPLYFVYEGSGSVDFKEFVIR